MGSLVDKHLKLEQPNLESTDTRPIKATKLALDITRANEIAIENSKTGKVTLVVSILKVFGVTSYNSRNATPGKSLSKPNRRIKSQKKGLNRSFKHQGWFRKPPSDASKTVSQTENYQGAARHRIEW